MILRKGFIIGLYCAVVGIAVLTAGSAVAQVRDIELKDGSVITGTVRSFDGETYVIESDSLGTLSLKNSQVNAIRSAGAQSRPPAISSGELMGIQQQLLHDGEVLDLIKALQNDPQIQAILNDPQLLQAIAAGDVQALMTNEKFKALIDNPKIQEISRKVHP